MSESTFHHPERVELAASSGYEVIADDGPAGRVEFGLETPDGHSVDFLVVRTAGTILARHPVVAAALVRAVDRRRRRVYVRGTRTQIRQLPESLPLSL